MYDDLYNENDYEKKPSKIFSIKNLLIVFVVIAVLFVIALLFSKDKVSYNTSSRYDGLINEIIALSNDYIIDHSLNDMSEVYLDSETLGISNLYDCSILSGSFIDSNFNIVPYLVCDGFKSKTVNNSNAFISLYGDDVVFVSKGSDYVEPGFDSRGFDVRVNNDIGSESGVYHNYYTVISNDKVMDVLKRRVVVIESRLVDRLYPKIDVSTSDVINIGEYIDINSFSASDSVDGDISNRVLINGDFNSNLEGEYNINYSVSNSRGYSVSVNRRVVVVNNRTLNEEDVYYLVSPTIQTNGNVKIMFSITSDIYNYCILPDGSSTFSKSFSYNVNRNGSYSFIFYDNKGNSVVKRVDVSNIIANNLSGSCNYTRDAYGITEINVNSNASYYNYIIGSFVSNDLISNSYFTSLSSNSVSVRLKDNYGNSSVISCSYVPPREPVSSINTNLKSYTFSNTSYWVANTINDLSSFAKNTNGKISQSADTELYGSSCLSFAQYHAYMLQKGSISSLKLYDAGHYKYASSFTDYLNPDKNNVLMKIFDEINNNRVVVLMVNGNSARTSRHFVTVVGFKKSVKSKESLSESDLLILDAWGGNIRTMDPSITSGYRTMFKQNGNYRLRVFR